MRKGRRTQWCWIRIENIGLITRCFFLKKILLISNHGKGANNTLVPMGTPSPKFLLSKYHSMLKEWRAPGGWLTPEKVVGKPGILLLESKRMLKSYWGHAKTAWTDSR